MTRLSLVERFAHFLGPVVPRRGQLLSFACPKESNPRKRHPLHRPLRGFPALLAKPGGCATRATRSDSARRLPPARLRYSAAQQGAPKTKTSTLRQPRFANMSPITQRLITRIHCDVSNLNLLRLKAIVFQLLVIALCLALPLNLALYE